VAKGASNSSQRAQLGISNSPNPIAAVANDEAKEAVGFLATDAMGFGTAENADLRADNKTGFGALDTLGFGAVADDWGFSSNTPTSKGVKASLGPHEASSAGEGAFDMSDLTAALQQAHHKQKQQKQQQKANIIQGKQQQQQQGQHLDKAQPGTSETSEDAVAEVCCKGPAGPLLPEFYLYAEPEPEGESCVWSSGMQESG
jgi:hypothetical protein